MSRVEGELEGDTKFKPESPAKFKPESACKCGSESPCKSGSEAYLVHYWSHDKFD